MAPIVFQCPLFTVYTYGLCIAMAFLVCSLLLLKEARRNKLKGNLINNICIIALLCGIICARIFYCVLHWYYFKDDILEIIMLQHGGLVWFGGLIGAVLSTICYLRLKKMPVLPILDLFAPYVALGQAIGRIGCFFNGCCYGKVSSWGFYFPSHQLKLFPVQLLASLALLIIFVILKVIRARGRARAAGEIFCFYLILASTQRFLIEFLRGDPRAFYGIFSIYQWLAIGIFSCAVVFYFILLWKRRVV